MDKKTAALKQALEALDQVAGAMPFPVALQVRAAIREALAEQPEQQPVQEQNRQIDQLIQERDHRDEIIDKLCDAVLGPDRYEWSSQYFFEDAVREVEERMSEQPAQQQEPFAYAFTGIKQNGEHHGPHLVWKPEYMDAMSASMGAVAVPLYTSPPASKPWVGLTDVNEMVEAELTHYWNGEYADTTGARDHLSDFARAIEAKLKERNA